MGSKVVVDVDDSARMPTPTAGVVATAPATRKPTRRNAAPGDAETGSISPTRRRASHTAVDEVR